MRRRLFTFVSALAIGVLASGAARPNQCRPIHTTITTHVVPCREGESPIGFCTAGAIHSGLLAGSTRFAAQTLEIVGGNMVYTGVLTVTTRSGDVVTLADRGILFTQ